MKKNILFSTLILAATVIISSCKSTSVSQDPPAPAVIETNQSGNGPVLTVEFTPGKYHNHPLMALWIEDMDGTYLQTLYIPRSIARGVFQHGSTSTGRWTEGAVRRPGALPYWGHRWGVQAEDGLYLPTPENPLPDAVSGATPQAAFVLHTKLAVQSGKKFRVMMEINQPWDWNEYWTNNKFPGDKEYATSCQPAVVYAATLDPESGIRAAGLSPVGHSHYAGKDGSLTTDLSTLTTALQIVSSVHVRLADN
jgi:hypothetical protein